MDVNMRRSRRGQVLILVLGVMGMGLLVVAPLLAFLDISFRLSMNYQMKTESYIVAEAGIERVIGDLYMATDIRVPTYDFNDSAVNEAPPLQGNFKFQINVTEPTTLGVAPLETESYLDPGSCLGMRPINTTVPYWDYDFFMTHGEDLKVSWAYYVADDACNPDDEPGTEYAWTVISLRDEDGPVVDVVSGLPVRSEVGPTDGGGTALGDESRMVVNTLYVQGAYPGPDGERGTPDDLVTVEGGPYILRFDNWAYRGAPDTGVSVCCPPFKGGDEDYVFSGSINCSELDCADFIDDTGARSGLARSVMLVLFNEDYGDDLAKGEINTDTFSCDYVQLNITKWDGNVSTYTFNNSDPVWGPHFAWYAAGTTDPGGANEGDNGNQSYASGYYDDLVTQMIVGGGFTRTPLGPQDYRAISHREGQRFDVPSPAAGGDLNALLQHMFQINETSGEVAWINVSWEGYQHKRAETADEDYNWQADDDELFLYMVNWYPGAGVPVIHVLDHRQQGGGFLDHRQQGGGFVWLKLYQGAYRDYLIKSIAYADENDNNDFDPLEDRKLAMVTAYLRQSPGPSVWWEEQSMEILSWNIQYFTQ
jgi:hypothetical protein